VRHHPRVIVNVPRADAGPGTRAVELQGVTHTLVPLGDNAYGPLYWQQPRVFRREWQLVSERGLHLLLHGHGITRRKLQAETPEATWTLMRAWGGGVTLADAEGRELARVPRGWFGRSPLELPGAPALTWRWRWSGARTLDDEEGREWLRLQRRFAFLRFEALVTWSETARLRKDRLELLAVTFFTWLSEPRGHAH
jgi:hypothetical protein